MTDSEGYIDNLEDVPELKRLIGEMLEDDTP